MTIVKKGYWILKTEVKRILQLIYNCQAIHQHVNNYKLFTPDEYL